MQKPYQFTFSNGHIATAIQVEYAAEVAEALSRLGLTDARPTLALVGGAGKMAPEDFACLRDLFVGAIAPAVERLGATVIDGGTDCGIMRLMGEARRAIDGTFPLLGVCAIGTIVPPNVTPPSDRDTAPLEPHHTHFMLVPGNNWGDECPWLAHVAGLRAGTAASATIVSNGGEITWRDVAFSVNAKRPTIVLAGSGRTADLLAAALGGEILDDRAEPLVSSGLLQAIDMKSEADKLAETLTQLLRTSESVVS